MARLRLAVKKEGALQFLSHLDFARAVRYVIIRAGLPICYSEGFNPHMKINFASALGVGVSADVEYMDMELKEKLPVQDVIQRMNAMSPNGFAVLDGKYVDSAAKKLMAAANYAVYDLTGPVRSGYTQAELDAVLQAFNDAPSVVYKKVLPKGKGKIRLIEIKHHVIDAVTGTTDGTNVALHLAIYQTEEGAVKPSQVWDVLCTQFHLPVEPDRMLACRRGIYQRKGEEICSLFDV